MMKRLMIVCITFLLIFTQAVAAETKTLEELIEKYMSDSVDMDRVSKYDISVVNVEESGEQLKNPEAVQTVLALGLMDYVEKGVFDENAHVRYEEFAEIIAKLAFRGSLDLSAEYSHYPDSQYATQEEAANYLVATAGYDVFDVRYHGENPRISNARQIGLLDKINYKGTQYITRGELAQMIYNMLNLEIVKYTSVDTNENFAFEQIKGSSLIEEIFDAVFVRGTVTSQYGIDMFSESAVDENIIKIDRASFICKDIVPNDYLGHNVFAIARKSNVWDEYELISIIPDERDNVVIINTGNIEGFEKNYIHYNVDDAIKKINIGNLEVLNINGKKTNLSEFMKALENEDGELRVCSERRGGEYTLGIFLKFETFKVSGISTIGEKIALDYGAKYEESNTISISDEKQFYVTLDGDNAVLGDIQPDMIISVLETPSKSAMLIRASSRNVKGIIDEVLEDSVIIGGNTYAISKSYKKYNDLPELELRKKGTFMLDYAGRIASFKEGSADEYRLGIMTKFGYDGNGIGKRGAIRVFADDNRFYDLTLAEKLTLDGETRVENGEAVEKMENLRSSIIGGVIRFGQNKNGEINFLDTEYQSENESDDSQQIQKDATWKGKHNWTVDINHKCLTGSPYYTTGKTKVFNIPDDLDDEESFSFAAAPSFVPETMDNLKLYNIDDFYNVGLVVRSETGATGLSGNYYYMIVMKVTHSTNEAGEEILIVNGLDGYANWVPAKFTIKNNKLIQRMSEFKVGDLIHYAAKRDVIVDLEPYKSLEALKTEDFYINPANDYSFISGNVLKIDYENQGVLVQTGDQIVCVYPRGTGIYNSKTNEAYTDTGLIEFQPGDRIFGYGGFQYMRLLVIH